MFKIKAIAIGLVSLVGFSTLGVAQEVVVPEGMKKGASVEGITEYTIKSNGLKVLLFPDQSKPTMTVNITYLVGSRHEGYGETGMAHLLEHMVFKGSPRHLDIPAELTSHGASPNGTTWLDRTNYFETFSASEENLRWALDLESDRMVNSFIKKEDLESEMTVVRNEFESGENSPTGILLERVLSTSFLWHNYGQSTIGARSDLENVPIENLQAFYKKFYQPDNAVLIVAGKIDESKTLELVKQYFEGIPKPTRKLTPTYTAEPTQDGERIVNLKRTGDLQAVSCAYHICSGLNKDFAAVSILDEILTDQPGGRLYKALVESKKAAGVWSFAPALKEPGFLYISAQVRKEKSLKEAEDALLNTLDELKKNPPTSEEVERARAKILKNWELSFNNSTRVGIQLSEFIAMGDWRTSFLYRDNIEKVTAEDVQKVALKYLKPSNRTVGRFIPTAEPDRVEISKAPNVKLLLRGYKGKEAIAKGEAFDVSPANIEKRTTIGGKAIKYALLSKETRGDAVVASMSFRFGDENSLAGKSVVADLTASMLNKGTESMSRQEITDKLNELKATVRIGQSNGSVDVRLNTTRENLSPTIKLIGEMLKSPSFDEGEFAKLKESQLAGLEAQLSEPQALAFLTWQKHLSPYPKEDVRYVMSLKEQADATEGVTLSDVKDFYKSFYGSSNTTVSVVGDFDENEIKTLINSEFGSWKSPKKYARIANSFQDVPAANENINTPDKANAMFVAGIPVKMQDTNEDYPAMVMANFIIGGGFLNSRLASRIRQQDGLSYGVGSFFQASSRDEAGLFGSYAIYAPENVKKLEAAYKEEIQKVIDDGFTQEELDEARSGWLQSQEVSRSQDPQLAGTLNSYIDMGRKITWQAKLEDEVKQLTAADLSAVVKKYLDLSKFVMVKAGDFEKK